MKKIIKKHLKIFLTPGQIKTLRRLSEAPDLLRRLYAKLKIETEYYFRRLLKVAVNKCEIRVIGTERCGSHAIINWIGSQCPGKSVYFINSVKPKTNPFTAEFYAPNLLIFNNFLVNREKEKTGKLVPKDCLIYSYEEEDLEEVFSDIFEQNHSKWVGESSVRYDILILRDPFNTFASKLRQGGGYAHSLLVPEEKNKLISLWKSYAKEYLGLTNFLKHNKIVINYNRWFVDREYRRELAQKIQFKFTDRGFHEVVQVGGGSSFSGTDYNGKADRMKVLERWKHFVDNEIYKDIFKDKELVELSNAIFGEISGTEIFLSTL